MKQQINRPRTMPQLFDQVELQSTQYVYLAVSWHGLATLRRQNSDAPAQTIMQRGLLERGPWGHSSGFSK